MAMLCACYYFLYLSHPYDAEPLFVESIIHYLVKLSSPCPEVVIYSIVYLARKPIH